MSLERVHLPNQGLKQYKRKGYKALKDKKIDKAKTYFSKGLKIDGTDLDCLAGLGYVYVANEQFIKALEQFKQVLKINPHAYHFFNSVGDCYFQLGFFSRAIEYYSLYLKMDSKKTSSYSSKGLAHLSLGDYSQMKNCYAQILKVYPNDIKAICYYGLSLLFNDQSNEAYLQLNGFLQQASQHTTKFTILAQLGIFIIFFATRKEQLQKHFNLYPEITNLILAYDDMPVREKEITTVQAFLDIALLEPKYQIEVHYFLGIAYRTIGEYALAHDSFIKALHLLAEMNIPFSELYLSSHMQIAFTYQKQHKIELAIKTLKEAEENFTIENEDISRLIRNLESKRMLSTPPTPHSALERQKPHRPLLFIPKEKELDLPSPESHPSTATTARSMINSPSNSPAALSPSASPMSERKRVQPLPTLKLAPTNPLASATSSGLFKPSEVKTITIPLTKSRCVIL